MPSRDTPRKPRRDQREDSRRRLFAATIGCLVDQGYGSTTTSAIARGAGLSNGALFHLYASKEDLIIAAVVDLVRRVIASVNQGLEEAGPTRTARQLVELSSAAMRSPEAQALLEFYAAARTNHRLQQALVGVEREITDGMVAYMAHAFPELAGTPELRGLVGLLGTATLGTALVELAMGNVVTLIETRSALVTALETALPAT